MVLLGIRMAWKNDIHCTTVELVYGTSLCVLGEFFDDSKEDPWLTLSPA